ncbi:MAG: aminomethyl-transferring glycine dehydrogenase subunit GcvPB [Deltaproteobacteria bacterium]|nr:aminomethyl-transferring glycine dehydrogenase subunit GcvPB [Deltaproteobacteria bacterium]
MHEQISTTGLILNEPLLWEKGKKGRSGFSIPRHDVERAEMDNSLVGEVPDIPQLSELDVVRHYTRLSTWNFGVDTGMYPLGSCTMKYNPKLNEKLAGLEGFASAHPLLPASLSQGMLELMYELEKALCEITGMDAVSLQPAAGAQGELTGMLLIHAFHKSQGKQKTKILVPDTAHGTNPASAVLCGYKPLPLQSSEQGIISIKAVEDLMDDDVAGIMITNPNTLGLFEENISEISAMVHDRGGLVYGDGANMNAIMGIVKMGKIGLDIIHLNLHKTFSAPHGGGGPGSGPVCVKKELEPFLPSPKVVKDGDKFSLSEDNPRSVGKVQAFYGNIGVMIKAYSYILTMGPELEKVSRLAVLNANYLKEKLKTVFHLAYDKTCMHECVFTDAIQAEGKVTALDIAKRLIDYGFHPPTIYFPLVVHGALMIEPTETESKENLDLFIDACKAIANEAKTRPELLLNAPQKTRSRRMDEVLAARKPCLSG